MSAGYLDSDYTAKGAQLAAGRGDVFRAADIVVQVLCHGSNDRTGGADLPLLRAGQVLVGFMRPLGQLETIRELAATGVTAFSIELMPRITRAQSMDALSSMATICGYKAVLLAADRLPKMFPMLTTAAGTITPARVFVIGAGVAGLQAIATARRLGAVASAYDCGPPPRSRCSAWAAASSNSPSRWPTRRTRGDTPKRRTKRFIKRQAELLGDQVAQSDVVISAAVVPGKKSPVLVTREMVHRMAPGSVVVDLAAERGGNCEITRAGEVVEEQGVAVLGSINLASTVPYHASQLYARNVTAFLLHLFRDGKLHTERGRRNRPRNPGDARAAKSSNPRLREFFHIGGTAGVNLRLAAKERT